MDDAWMVTEADFDTMDKATRIRHSRRGGKHLDHMRVRRALLTLVLEQVGRSALTRFGLARMCGTSEPRVWHLLRGHIELFNSETLIDILARLGVTVDIVVTKRTYRVASFGPERTRPRGM